MEFEINDLLRNLQGGSHESEALGALQTYRREALDAAKLPDPEARIDEARQQLKTILSDLILRSP